METFSALLGLCVGNLPVTGEFPGQSPVTRGFDVFFDLRLNKRLNKQARRRWFKTPSRHYDVIVMIPTKLPWRAGQNFNLNCHARPLKFRHALLQNLFILNFQNIKTSM